MIDPNPYRSPADTYRHPANRNRVWATILALVLLDVGFSAYKIVRNLPDLLKSPDSTAVLIGGILVFWMAWIGAELFAAWLIWRGHAAGRWVLVASFGLKAMGRVAIVWPLLIRGPLFVVASPYLNHALQAVCYGGATLWLLFLPAFENRAVRDRGTSGHLGSDATEKDSFIGPN